MSRKYILYTIKDDSNAKLPFKNTQYFKDCK